MRGSDRRRDRLAAERGLATVWTAGACAALIAVAALVIGLGAAVITRHRASAAADLAALAAAAHATDGMSYACGRARWVVEHMHGRLESCRLRARDALVEVTAEPPGVLAGFGPAAARARAGPAER